MPMTRVISLLDDWTIRALADLAALHGTPGRPLARAAAIRKAVELAEGLERERIAAMKAAAGDGKPQRPRGGPSGTSPSSRRGRGS